MQAARQEMVATVAEAHAGLRELAFKLRRELTMKAPELKAAIKAEQEVFRLKRYLQQPSAVIHPQSKALMGTIRGSAGPPPSTAPA